MPGHHRHYRSPGRTRRRGTPLRPGLIALAGLLASGCAGFNPDETAGPRPPPEGKRLAELAAAAFATAKLAGPVEVSPVRATHDNQIGEWTFCITSPAPDAPKYAVLVARDAVLDVRSRVLIDGCEHETYQPLAIRDQRPASRKPARSQPKPEPAAAE